MPQSKMTRRRGFSLVEVLIVLMVFSVMTGALCVRLAVGDDSVPVVRAEAESLAEWLTSKMTRARAEGNGFMLEAHRSWGESDIARLKLTRRGAPVGDAEYYVPKGATIDIARISSTYTYDSDWHTLTPAVSINLRSKRRPAAILYIVTVSGQGYVSVKPQGGRKSEGA